MELAGGAWVTSSNVIIETFTGSELGWDTGNALIGTMSQSFENCKECGIGWLL